MQQFFLKSQIFATEGELMILENTVTVASLAKPDLASLVYTHCELSLACLGVTGYFMTVTRVKMVPDVRHVYRQVLKHRDQLVVSDILFALC